MLNLSEWEDFPDVPLYIQTLLGLSSLFHWVVQDISTIHWVVNQFSGIKWDGTVLFFIQQSGSKISFERFKRIVRILFSLGCATHLWYMSLGCGESILSNQLGWRYYLSSNGLESSSRFAPFSQKRNVRIVFSLGCRLFYWVIHRLFSIMSLGCSSTFPGALIEPKTTYISQNLNIKFR